MKHCLKLLMCFSVGSFWSFGQTTVTVNPDNRYQSMKGWGVSLCWWANDVGSYPTAATDTLCKWIADPNQLNMNVFRFNIGGGDDPSHTHMSSRNNMPGYKKSATSAYDWKQDTNQRLILLKLNKLRKDVINEAFINSPPYWMTKSGCASGNTDGSDNLNDTQYAAYADYITEVVKHYKDKFGIPFTYLEPFNEPFSGWWKALGAQEGCKISLGNQQKLMPLVYNNLVSKNMTGYCHISAMDANSIDECVSGINGYISANIMSQISKINTHTYYGSQRSKLYSLSQNYNKELWQSESGPINTGVQYGFPTSLYMSQRIITDLRDLKPVVWCDWQLLDPYGDWRLLNNNPTTKSFVKEKNFYVRMQCSRFIKQGYTIVDTNEPNTVAAINPANTEIVLVICNQGTTAQDMNLNLSAFGIVGDPSIYRTSATENCEKLTSQAFQNKKQIYSAPAQSLTTYVIPVSLFNYTGTFQLVARHSNKVVDIGSNGYAIQNTNTKATSQQWNLVQVGGYYKVLNVNSGKALDVSNGSLADSASILEYPYSGSDNQLWSVHNLGNGYFELINKNSDKALEVIGGSLANAAAVVQSTFFNANFQEFLLSPLCSSSITSSSQSFCTGSSLKLSTVAGTSYIWFEEGKSISSLQNITVSNAGTYSVQVTNASGCTSVSPYFNVIENPLPQITPNLYILGTSWQNSSSATACSGQSLQFGPWPVQTNGWSWSGPNGYKNATRDPTLSNLITTNSGIYTASYTDANGCKSAMDFNIAVKNLPVITPYINVDNKGWTSSTLASVCAGRSVLFGPWPTVDSGWNWTGPNNFYSTLRSLSFQNISIAQQGTYKAIYTDANSCSSSADFTITVNPVPVITVTNPANNTTIATSNFTISTSVTGNNISNVGFYNGGSLLGTDASSPYSFLATSPANGTYTYAAIAKNTTGCSDTAKVTVKISKTVTGTSEESFEQGGISLSPNPFSELAILKKTGAFGYSITDLKGTVILSGKGENQIELGESLRTGFYILIISDNTGKKIYSLIKQ